MSQIQQLTLQLAVERWRGPSCDLYGPGHALLLGLLKVASSTAATALHDADRRKPFALSPLHVTGTGAGTARARLVVSTWDHDLGALLQESLDRALDVSVAIRHSPAILLEANSSSPISPLDLLAHDAVKSVAVRFASPTFFSLGRRFGRQQYGLLPDPELTVRSWLRPWIDAGGPFEGELGDWGWVRERVAVRDIRSLATEVVDAQKTALTGFTGEVVYAWTGPEPWGPHLLGALARFAHYCGTGAKTGHGFGQTVCLWPKYSVEEATATCHGGG